MEYLEIAKIVAPQGLKGEMRATLQCDSPEFFTSFDNYYLGDSKAEIEIISARQHKNVMVIRIDGINSIEDVQKYIGKTIFINKEDVMLEDGRYFWADLLGMDVIDAESGEIYGKLNDIQATGANDIYEVKKGGKSVWIPAIAEVIKKVDVDGKKMFITPMEGLF